MLPWRTRQPSRCSFTYTIRPGSDAWSGIWSAPFQAPMTKVEACGPSCPANARICARASAGIRRYPPGVSPEGWVAQVAGIPVPASLVQCQHAVTVGRLPPELERRHLQVIAQATTENKGLDGEVAQDLRQLCGMPEGVWQPAVPGRPAQLLCDPDAQEQVADQGLARGQELVGLHVPGSGARPAALEKAAQGGFALGAQCQVVLSGIDAHQAGSVPG